ncbi:MAG: U32 family peptidase [Eubacteriales bacterium]
MTTIPELLAPAGSPEALDAAIRAGADAVYLGSTLFNARMSAKNFTRPALTDAVKTAHEAGVRVYVTLNTTVLDRQMREAMELVDFLYHTGVDALIVSDPGLASEIHRIFPDFPLHGSTQCSGHNADAAKFLHEQGFSLMVCARECRKEDIRQIIRNSPIPIEVFVHGALCVSASGQCLMSSFIGGRSGNRGECAQPCRMPYQGGYPLSLKDNCLAGHITELIEMGVASLKIEGRMKSPEYVGGVTAVYRRLLDQRRNATDEEISRLAALFSRDGFTDGYFTGRHEKMNGIRRDEDKAASGRMSGTVAFSHERRREPIVVPERPNRLPEGYRPPAEKLPIGRKTSSARFYQAKSIPEKHSFDVVYLPLDRFDGRVANGVLLPPTVYESEKDGVRAKLIAAKKAGAVHAMVPNIGQIRMAQELGFVLHGDFRLNITNSLSARLFGKIFKDFLLSPELTAPQCRDISGEKGVIVYGRVPLMLLEKSPCVQKLVDRKKVSFPILREAGRDLIFNSVPIYMADKQDILRSMGDYHSHMIFTVEGIQEVSYLLENYKKGLPTKKEIRRIKG